MNSEAASSSSHVRIAVPPKRERVEDEIQTNETMKDLNEAKEELEPCSILKRTKTCGRDCSRIAIRSRGRRKNA